MCFALHGEAGIVPYYLYPCDMVPGMEHWRIPVHEARHPQDVGLGPDHRYRYNDPISTLPESGSAWRRATKAKEA